jgi:hypothetical protein
VLIPVLREVEAWAGQQVEYSEEYLLLHHLESKGTKAITIMTATATATATTTTPPPLN